MRERTCTVGVEIHPAFEAADLVKWIVELEELGFDEAWFADSHMIMREVFCIMAAAASATNRIKLGTGVTQLVTRHPTVVASTMATLAELSSGRVICGIGLGDSAVETIGMKPNRRRELADGVEVLRQLWRGEDVSVGEAGSMGLPWWKGSEIPVFYASSGPKMLRDAGRIADGVIAYVGVTTSRVAAARRLVEDGASEVERTFSQDNFVLWVPFSTSDDDIAAISAVKAHAARALLHGSPEALPDDEMEVVSQLRGTYDYKEHMDPAAHHNHVVPDEIALRYAIAGNPQNCIQQLTDLLDRTNITRIGLIPMGDDRPAVIRQGVSEVLKPLSLLATE